MSPTVIAKNEFRLQKFLQLCMWREGAREKGDVCVCGGGGGRCQGEGAREKGGVGGINQSVHFLSQQLLQSSCDKLCNTNNSTHCHIWKYDMSI